MKQGDINIGWACVWGNAHPFLSTSCSIHSPSLDHDTLVDLFKATRYLSSIPDESFVSQYWISWFDIRDSLPRRYLVHPV
jgi:hypothetical protein